MTILGFVLVYGLALSLALGRAGVRSQDRGRTGDANTWIGKILVVGASGGTGKQVVSQALERGYEVTAFVRDRARIDLIHPRLRVAEGDVLDKDSVEVAVRGQDAVISTLGHKRFFYPTRILSEGTANLLRSMGRQGVRRFICQTSLGIGNSAGRMGLY